MAIVKMKFVSAITDKANLDQMLLTSVNTGLLAAEHATNIITEENGGQLIAADSRYSGYVQTFKNIARSVGYNLTRKASYYQTYTPEEIESYIQELNTEFGLDTNAEREVLSQDDEAALDALSVCDFEKMNECQYLNFKFGRLPMDSFKKLTLYKDEIFALHKFYQNNQYVWILYVTSDSHTERANRIFKELFFEPIRIPKFDVRKRVEQCHLKMDDMYSYVCTEAEINDLYPYVAKYGDEYVLSGFMPSDKVKEYESAFLDQRVTFTTQQPSEVKELKCPTLLKNNWFVRPFELFVEMYGLPSYEDFDPTIFMAVTYCILFGIMFGDFGQGLILAILGLVFEKKGKLFGIVNRVGLTSMVFGFLFGSVFGYEDILNPIHQNIFNVREKLFDVMESSNTMPLLIGAIIVGSTLIIMSMLLNIYNNIHRKRWGEVLFSQNGIAGLLFYNYLVLGVAAKVVLNVNPFTPLMLVIFVGLPIFCFFFREPIEHKMAGKPIKPKEGWGAFVIQTFFEVFEILLSFVTNSMSYLRVGGFVLSHAGMMLVVMTLAEMVGHSGFVIIIFGNIFVMMLEGLIVGIQTLRLEYYEMFSRYYTGDGKKFKRIETMEAK